MATSDLDDEIPPLEDIPNLPTKVPENTSTPVVKKCLNAESEDNNINNNNNNNNDFPKATTETKPSSSFGGFKKGFLNNKSNKSIDKESKNNEIIHIKSNPSNKTDLKINNDIKDAIKESGADVSKAWLTDDLLEKIDKSDVLKKGFMNSRLIDKISKFQQNPQAALKECENDIEAQIFLKEFLKVMGSHLTTNTSDVKTTAQPEVIKKADDPEQKKVNELINNDEVRQLLMDKDVQELFTSLRNNPQDSQRILRSANKEMQIKIQKLISYGLLGIQS